MTMWMSLHKVKKVSIEHRESATPGTMMVELSFKREDGTTGSVTCFLVKDAEVSIKE